MFWSRSLYSASRAGAPPVMTLREATQTARRMGCLGTPPNTTPAAPSCSPSTASTPVADPLLLRRCTGADARGSNSPSPSEATWSGIVLRQRQLFQNSHTPSDGGAVAVSVSAVNTIHVEGEVAAVWCGYEASNSAGRAGDGFPNRRTVSMTTPVNRDFPTVLLWLSMEDASGRADTSCLLAVRCRLSPEVVELRWRAQQQAAAANADGDAEKSSAVEEAGVDARLRCVKAWASTALLHRRVVVSGQLRVSEVYDGDLDAVVAVPVVELPQDNLLGSVTVLRSEKVKLSKVSQF